MGFKVQGSKFKVQSSGFAGIGPPGLAIARIGLCPQTRTFHSADWCYSCCQLRRWCKAKSKPRS